MPHASRRPARWPWLLVAIAVAAMAWWLLRPAPPPLQDAPTMPPALAHDALPPPSMLPGADEPPGIQHPVAPAVDAADAAIPTLADSDAAVLHALEALAGDPSVFGVLVRGHVVQRLVVMVDNLTEPRVTAPALALRPLPGEYAVIAGGSATVADAAANSARYAPYVAAFTGADAGRVADAYRRFYPLFQAAYVELGYPDGYFNDRLVQVIDHLLQAPVPQADTALVRDERGRWRYADPALESASVGHKALMRLSAGQQAAVKAQLRALRRALARP